MHRNPSRSASRTGLKSITTAYPPQSPRSGYTRGKLESMSAKNGLTNQSPVSIERPVNKQASPDQILLRHRPPVAAVVAVVTVVAHREITMLRHNKRMSRLRQIIAAQSIAAIGQLRRHDAGETKAFRDFSIHIKPGRINPQRITGQPGQALDVGRRAGFRIFTNPQDMIRAENKYVAAVRLDEVVTKFIDEDLIASVHRAARNHLPTLKGSTQVNVEIMLKRVLWAVNPIKMLALARDLRKRKKEKNFLRLDLSDLVLAIGDNVDVIATQHNELRDSLQNIRRQPAAGMTDDSIQCRLHRTGGNLERL